MLEIAAAASIPFRRRADAVERDGRAFPQLSEKVLPVLVKEEIGVLGMKPLASGVDSEKQDRQRRSNACITR